MDRAVRSEREDAALVRSDRSALLAPEPVIADELASRVAQAQALAELGELAAHAKDPDRLVWDAVHVVLRGLDAGLVAILERDGAGALRARAATQRELAGARLGALGALADEAIDSGAPAARGAPPAEPGANPAAPELASALCVPLSDGARALGALCAASAAGRAFDAADTQFLQIAANVLAGYLGRHAAMAEMQAIQTRLALADRLLASATVAAGLAHEINNPLAAVAASLSWIEEALQDVPPGATPSPELRQELAEAIRDARRGAERMRDLVRDLRALNRVDEADLSAVTVGPLVRACARIASAEVAGRARLVLDLEDAPAVHGNEARLGQVLLNLLVNAAQAISPGKPESNEVRVTVRRHGSGAALEVRDTGCGIDAGRLERLFEPFVAGSAPGGIGRGRGLGLAICHQVVTSLGGDIAVESAPGKGSTFRVVLRGAPPEAPAGSLAVEASRASR